jgi:hypothetical protein
MVSEDAFPASSDVQILFPRQIYCVALSALLAINMLGQRIPENHFLISRFIAYSSKSARERANSSRGLTKVKDSTES